MRAGGIDTSVSVRQSSAFDDFKQATGGVRLLPKAEDRDLHLNLEEIELSVSPVLQPLRLLAEATAGEAIRVESQVAPAIASLGQRFRAFFLTDRLLDGRLRPIAVRLATTARDLRSAQWVRASTPETVTEMRLREALGGGSPTSLSPRLQIRTGGERSLAVAIDWNQDAQLLGRDGSMVRISIARRLADGSTALEHHVVAAGEPEGDGLWRYAVPIERFDGPAVVGVEALEVGAWAWGSLAGAA